MDNSAFHASVFALKPNQPSKPSTYWAAVLRATLKPSTSLKEEDFLWIKCHGSIKVGTVLDQYRVKNKDHGIIKLKLGDKLPSEGTMRQLDEFHDQLLAFEAVRISELPARMSTTRLPLQPTNRQVKVELTRASPPPTIKREAGYYELATTHKTEPAATSTPKLETSSRPDWAISNGFALWDSDMRTKLKENWSFLTETQTKDILLERWLKLSSTERQSYEELAKNSIKNTEVKFEPIKTDLMVKDEVPENENSINPAGSESRKQQSFHLQMLLKDASPETLETSVEQGVKLLDSLKKPMINKIADTPDAKQWIEQIDNLRKQAVKTRTVIGVVGNTGAGKSSVINAMLDEERLLPTSCMRACTAVVTEISYNDAEKPYRAHIEFIKQTDWEKELKTLFQDLIDSNGNLSRECNNPDTDAGIAYAKIKAVYPKKTKEDIANSSTEKMLLEVSHVLGTSRNIEETDSLRFYQKLQTFVDSKEKSTGDKEKDKKRETKEMEFWPLIRVVRIYVKSAALQTGAVIVDLPGVHDSNAARAAVAENYMKECTGLWIVAPINRAVDDKAAKTLLGESFKRQLKMDGGFSSKTDDISLMEAQESLGLERELGESWHKIEVFNKKAKELENELQVLKDSKAVYGEIINDADEQIEVWESLKDSVEDGKTVYAPQKERSTKKRKNSDNQRSRKKQRYMGMADEEVEDEDYGVTSASDGEVDGEVPEHSEERGPLEEAQITAKINEIRATKKEARKERAELTEKSTVVREKIDEARASAMEIEAEISSKCISGRNQYSKGAIQQDFAAGMKELDEEIAEEADEENFDPEIELRDYEQVARDLPVFCVSSRSYQKLQGRLRKDPKVPGFERIEETEIPQLQAHCSKLTEKGRIANCKRFINNLSLLLNSLALWASNDGTGANMTADETAREDKSLEKNLGELESGLEEVIAATCKEFHEELRDNIFDKYDSAISSAKNEASTIAEKWGLPVNRDNRSAGGYFWSTYKAICRRNGVYSNAQGLHEWNLQLCEPMMKILTSGWEKTFSRRLPMVLMEFTRNAAKQLKDFHHDVDDRAQKVGVGIAGLHMLRQQLSEYENVFKDLANIVKDNINNIQKEINREFTPVIERAMAAAYTACVDEHGSGSYVRMKAAMNSHVDQERHVMFRNSANEAKSRLEAMIQRQEEIMGDRTDEVFVAMRRDYRSVLVGGNLQGGLLSKPQRFMKNEVISILGEAENIFKKIVGKELDDIKYGDKLSQEALLSPNLKSGETKTTMKGIKSQQEILQDDSMERNSECADTFMKPAPKNGNLSISNHDHAHNGTGGLWMKTGQNDGYSQADLSSDGGEAESYASLSEEVHL